MSRDITYGAKDLYQGMLLASQPLDINGVHYDTDDVLVFFDSIQAINFAEVNEQVTANGGYDNRAQVHWDTTRELDCQLVCGRVSKMGYGIVNKTILNAIQNIRSIRQFDKLHVDDDGRAKLRHTPILNNPKKHFKIMKFQNNVIGCEILDYRLDKDTLILKDKDIDILVDYWFAYQTDAASVKIGQKSLNGYLKFVGKFYYTDEQGSSQNTAIIEIPNIMLQSDLVLDFGRNTNPLVSNLIFKAIPVGDRGHTKTMEIIYLNDDIDADI